MRIFKPIHNIYGVYLCNLPFSTINLFVQYYVQTNNNISVHIYFSLNMICIIRTDNHHCIDSDLFIDQAQNTSRMLL